MIQSRLTDKELQRCHKKLHSNPLCDGYKLFKADFTFEMYLAMLRPAERICMFNFRCGNQNLPVSAHPYDHGNNPKSCTFRLTGNEFHYVLFFVPFLVRRDKS